jgi:hypothetical protein
MSKSPALRPPISDLRSPASVYPSDQIAFGPDNVQDAPRCAGGYQHRAPRSPTPFQKGSGPIQKGLESPSHPMKHPKREKFPHNRKAPRP